MRQPCRLHPHNATAVVTDRYSSKAGGVDNGEPRKRQYSIALYSAFVLDPLGNNIEAMHVLKE